MEDFHFIDRNGERWPVPEGACTNGASIPEKLWQFIGEPFGGAYTNSSIIHDFYVGERIEEDDEDVREGDCKVLGRGVSFSERRKADKMFYEACRCEGCSKKKAVLYIGASIGTYRSVAISILKPIRNLIRLGRPSYHIAEEINKIDRSFLVQDEINQIYAELLNNSYAPTVGLNRPIGVVDTIDEQPLQAKFNELMTESEKFIEAEDIDSIEALVNEELGK